VYTPLLSTDCRWRQDASVQPIFRSWRSFLAKLWGKPASKKFLQGFTIRFWKKWNRHLYQDFPLCQTNSRISISAPARATGKRENFVGFDVSELIWTVPSWEPMGSWVILLYAWAPLLNWKIYIVNRHARRFSEGQVRYYAVRAEATANCGCVPAARRIIF
jgi:hypothetical protein